MQGANAVCSFPASRLDVMCPTDYLKRKGNSLCAGICVDLAQFFPSTRPADAKQLMTRYSTGGVSMLTVD